MTWKRLPLNSLLKLEDYRYTFRAEKPLAYGVPCCSDEETLRSRLYRIRVRSLYECKSLLHFEYYRHNDTLRKSRNDSPFGNMDEPLIPVFYLVVLPVESK